MFFTSYEGKREIERGGGKRGEEGKGEEEDTIEGKKARRTTGIMAVGTVRAFLLLFLTPYTL